MKIIYDTNDTLVKLVAKDDAELIIEADKIIVDGTLYYGIGQSNIGILEVANPPADLKPIKYKVVNDVLVVNDDFVTPPSPIKENLVVDTLDILEKLTDEQFLTLEQWMKERSLVNSMFSRGVIPGNSLRFQRIIGVAQQDMSNPDSVLDDNTGNALVEAKVQLSGI